GGAQEQVGGSELGAAGLKNDGQAAGAGQDEQHGNHKGPVGFEPPAEGGQRVAGGTNMLDNADDHGEAGEQDGQRLQVLSEAVGAGAGAKRNEGEQHGR